LWERIPIRDNGSSVSSLAGRPKTKVLLDIYQRLFRAFGPQHWWPGETPFEVAVGAVLTQNTAWENVEKATAVLKSRGLLTLERLARLSPTELAPLIRSTGYYNVKAARLAALLGWLRSQGGLAGLKRIPTPKLRSRLLACHGIGPETADSILLYALNRPVFVIDAYTRRILSRYGLAQGNEPYESLRTMFETSLPRRTRLFNEYHALLVRLAREHCRARPTCPACPLA